MALYVQDIDDERIPVLPNGKFFSENLILDHAVFFGESVADLVSGLIPGYLKSDDRADARASFCEELAWKVQQSEIEKFEDRGQHPDLDEWERHAVSEDRFVYDEVVDLDEWEHEMRLVLLTSRFRPTTALVPPTGNILWVDGSSDTALINSIHEAGVGDWVRVNARLEF